MTEILEGARDGSFVDLGNRTRLGGVGKDKGTAGQEVESRTKVKRDGERKIGDRVVGRAGGRERSGREKIKQIGMQHTTTGGWNEGGVKLGQLGVATPGGWDQYSLFLSSSLPRSRVHGALGFKNGRQASCFSLPFLPRACFPFASGGSLRSPRRKSLYCPRRRREALCVG